MFRPTPPQPNTATDWPGWILAAFHAAPLPVTTAHPTRAAYGSGTPCRMGTTEAAGTTAYSAQHDTLREWYTT